MDQLIPSVATSTSSTPQPARLRSLQALGILCGFGAGAWLGAAEAPTKLVVIGISPIVISLLMVAGVFLARWSLPALIRGTGQRLMGRPASACTWSCGAFSPVVCGRSQIP